MTARYKRPDKKNALSILAAARRDMRFTLSLVQNEDSAPTIVRNIYESFRMLGEASLVAKGIQSQDHIEPIRELLSFEVVTARPINLIDSLRRLRHSINYYGYAPKMAEVTDAISIAENCFGPLAEAVQRKIESARQ